MRNCCAEMKEEVVYYDACEDPEELRGEEQASPLRDPGTPTIMALSRRLQQLETKRGAICSRRAYLRNKKVRRLPPDTGPQETMVSLHSGASTTYLVQGAMTLSKEVQGNSLDGCQSHPMPTDFLFLHYDRIQRAVVRHYRAVGGSPPPQDQCVDAHEQKEQQAQESTTRFHQHHSVQLVSRHRDHLHPICEVFLEEALVEVLSEVIKMKG